MFTVGNLRFIKQKSAAVFDKDKAYIRVDRSSVLGNPFELTDKSNSEERDLVVQAYREWIWENIKSQSGYISLDRWSARGIKISSKYKIANAQEVVQELHNLLELESNGYNVVLLCWCSPAPCHADIIKRAITYLKNQQSQTNPKITESGSFTPNPVKSSPKILLISQNKHINDITIYKREPENVVFFDQSLAIQPPFRADSCYQLKQVNQAYRVWLERNINSTRPVNLKNIADDYHLFYDRTQYIPNPNEVREFVLKCLKMAKDGLTIVARDADANSTAAVFRLVLCDNYL